MFDTRGRGGRTLKAFVVTIRRGEANRTRVHNYCTKEDPAPLQHLLRPLTPLPTPGDGGAAEPATFGEMLNTVTNVRTGMKRLMDEYPDEFYRNGGRIMPMLTMRLGRTCTPTYNITQFHLEGYGLPLPVQEKAIVLYGNSEIGKTALALAHFERPLLVTCFDDLKKIGLDCDGLVFDDMDFTHLTAEGVIAILDMEFERSIKCRYQDAEIPAGLPRIFTTNVPEIFPPGRTEAQQRGIARRYTRIGPLKADLRV